MLDQRLAVAKAHRQAAKLQMVQQLLCHGKALHLKGDHGAEIPHLLLCGGMIRMAGQAGIIDPLHQRTVLQPPGHCRAAPAVGVHADLQGLQPPQDQISLLRPQDGAGDVLPANGPDLGHLLPAAHGKARDHIAVAVEIFGGAVENDIRAQRQRLGEDGRGEGIVHHHQRLGRRFMGQRSHSRNVDDLHVGVGRRFKIDHGRIGPQGLRKGLPVVEIHQRHLHAEAGQRLGKEGEGAAVKRPVGHQMPAPAQEGKHRPGDRSHAGGEGNAVLRPLQKGDLFLQPVHGGVAQAGIDKAPFTYLKILVSQSIFPINL